MSAHEQTRRKKSWLIFTLCVLLIVLALGTTFLLWEPRRELAKLPNPDGTCTFIVGQERLCGLFGVEIIHEIRDAAGHPLSASVKGHCSSWQEAKQKYAPVAPN